VGLLRQDISQWPLDFGLAVAIAAGDIILVCVPFEQMMYLRQA
jgi:uncharacterized integral membrane protein